MTAGFSVDPGVVRDAGRDLSVLADAILLARNCARDHLDVPSGGFVLNDIASSINGVRTTLVDDYSPGGTAYTIAEEAGIALRAIARDYEDTDNAQRAAFDALIDGDEPSQDVVYLGGRPGIELSNYTFVSTVTDGLDGYNDLDAFTQNVEYVIGLDWMSGWLTTAGIIDPLSGFRESLEGDWRKLGLVLGAMDNLRRFWETASAEINSIPTRFEGNYVDGPNGSFYQRNSEYNGAPNWSGNAAEATTAWLQTFSAKAADHAYAIELKHNEVMFRLIAVYSAMDLLLDTLQDLIEIMPWGQSFDDFLKDFLLPWRALDRLRAIAGLAAKTFTRARVLMSLVSELAGLFEGLLYQLADIQFPNVPYSAPAVIA